MKTISMAVLALVSCFVKIQLCAKNHAKTKLVYITYLTILMAHGIEIDLCV